jgi:zinc D-Ala-D-Ala carboxypeptidase
MQLSKNLYLSEVTKSRTAKRLGISNEPTKEHLVNLQILAEKIFQPIRDYYGCPIYISSGYRSEALNKAIGGSKSSQHCKGQAIDIDRDAYSLPSNAEIFEYIKNNLEFDQLIWEFGSNTNPDWVHVSYNTNGSQRKQILVAYKDSNNRTKYKSYE